MLSASGRVEAMLGSSSPDVKALAGIFLALYLLAATQDIAVDPNPNCRSTLALTLSLTPALPLPLPLPL